MKGPFKFFALFSLALPLALCSCENASSSPSTYVASTDVVAAKYSVTFDTDGGTAVQAQTVESGKTAVRPEDPEKVGFVFCGWFKSDLSGAFDFEKPVTSNVTVKAKWEKKLPEGIYLVIFDTDGGTPVPSHQNIRSGNRAIRPAADPAKERFSFCGWYKSDLSEEFDFGESITQDTRVRAKWSGPRRVVFHANGGEGIMADQMIFPCASEALSANAFTRADHKFLGWAESADGEKIYDDKSEVKIEAGEDPLNLYAVWEVKFRENSSMAVTGDIAVRRPDETVRYAPVSAWPDTEYPGYSDYEPLGVCVKNAASDKPFMISLTQETLTWTAAKNKHPADNWSVISQDNAHDVYANKEALNESLNKIGATPLDSGSYWVGENKVCSFNDGSVTDQLTGEALVRTVRPLKNIGKIVFEKSEVRKAAGAGAFVNALSNNGDGIVTYSSSNESVATVNAATGEVSIVGSGDTTITATVAESDAWAYAISKVSYTLHVGEVASISYAETTVSKLPNAASFTHPLSNNGDGVVTYSSSDTGVATVNAATGEVSIVSEG
ncbi:MAG: InlB B-repeat-containing protein, partial [Treponema sp.]|nr:InlB B-repeat-containing protein [Treponema sp.]